MPGCIFSLPDWITFAKFHAAWYTKDNRKRQGNQRQHRTKPACRLCAASADEFSVISHRNSLQYASIPASFLCNLTKNLLAHLGVCTDTIRNWLKASGIQPKETERQNRLERRQRDLEAENRALRKQLAQKDEVIEILKKSVGILSKP